jgi:methylglutaconyl-CoA hydratase
LVHEVVAREHVEEAGARLAAALARNGPEALREAKALLRSVSGVPLDDALMEETARRIARVRASEEGREGVSAFLERRAPAWAPD